MKQFLFYMSAILLGMGLQALIVSWMMELGIARITSGSQMMASVMFMSQSALLGGIWLFIDRRESK